LAFQATTRQLDRAVVAAPRRFSRQSSAVAVEDPVEVEAAIAAHSGLVWVCRFARYFTV
jgi:hypothetical protein